MNTTKIKKIGVIISLLALIGSGFFVLGNPINEAFAVDFGSIQVTVNPANSTPIDNELNAMIVAVLDGDAYLNDPGEYIPDENFTGGGGRTFTINNVPLNGTNTYTIAVAFFKEQQKSVDYGLYTVSANGTTLAPGTQSGSFMSNIPGTRSGNTVSYAINIARSNPTLTLTTTPPSLTNQNTVTIAGTTRKNSTVTVTGGAAAANTTSNSSGAFSLNVTLNQNILNALQVKATDTAGAISNIVSASVTNDNTAPIITLSGANPQTIGVGSAYTELGATATDSFEGNITGRISINTSAVNTNALGSYAVRYNVTDSSGNAAVEKTRTVNVVDTTKPVITRVGGSPVSVEAGTSYTDAGATATDNVDGNITASIVATNPVNINALGSYTVRYNVTDSSGNTATEVTRAVNVADTTKPIVTRNGSATVTVEHGSIYVDAGATASDSFAGNLTASIVVTNPVNTNALGNYTVRYNVTDSSGNAAIEVTRTVTVVDTTKPVITRLGVSPINHEAATAYVDAGATAADNVNGNITANIVVTNPVNVNALGSYIIRYNVTDSSGNAATEAIRTVNVVDTTKPIITRNGSAVVTIEVGSAYADAGATATDSFQGNVTANIVATNPVNSSVLGTYTIRYNVIDSSGNAANEVTRTVNVVDTTAPVITVTGANPQTIEVGSAYTELGATASDNYDGNITANITKNASAVNTNVLSSYTVTYNVSDSSGNAAVQRTRTVNVVDTTKPVITRIGESPINAEAGTSYTDAGAMAFDNYNGNITANIVTTNPVNTNALGNYTVRYDVIDTSGNAAIEVTRAVNVVDTTSPVITLLGSSTVSIEYGSVYTDAGATALDTVDGNITSQITVSSNVNTNALGTYTVRYNVPDAAGNAATEVVRTVAVVDTTKPVITLNGDSTVNVEFASTYVDAGTATLDNHDGNLAGSVVSSSSVNTNILGSYEVSFNVSDSSGNAADEVIRIVNVVDSTPPVISLTGASTITHEAGTPYTDEGATASDNYDGSLTANIAVISTVNVNAIGDYEVRYNVTDSSSNPATEVVRIVQVRDSIAPVIALIGDATVTTEFGISYVDAGATVTDSFDPAPFLISTSTVDENTLGTYSVTYSAADSSENNAAPVIRTVNVVDTTAPVITILGANPQIVEGATSYIELGATANDNVDGDVSANIVIATSSINTSVLGSYAAIYSVNDSSGNSASATRIVEVVDTTKPVIILNGSSTIIIEFGSVYTDVGATATDNVNGDITANIAVTNPVNTNTLGSYTVRYNVSDSSGNDADEVMRTVNVVDTTIPVISLIGSSTVTAEAGVPYIDEGATATDNYDNDNDITVAIVSISTVNTSELGTYSVTYGVSDSSDNPAIEVTRTVIVEDTIAPVITLIGDATVTTEFGLTYTDAGANVTDSFDPAPVLTLINTVDTNTLGTYFVTYDATDASNNIATSVTRTVHVTDTTAPNAPVMTNSFPNPIHADFAVLFGEAEQNATVIVTGGTSIATGTVSESGAFIISVPLSQNAVNTLQVTATDASNNTSTPSEMVIVEDSTEPVVTITGLNPETIEVHSAYVDAGATALDSVAGDLTASITTSSNVNVNVLGEYAVTYNVSDIAGNLASSSRIVNVADTIAPVLTLTGSSTVTIEVGSAYVDAGATALDNYDIDITANITSSSDVNTNALGTYSVVFSVSDSSGNTASTTRTVEVVDSTKPTITLNGSSTVTIEFGDAYVDVGATASDNYDGDITENIAISGVVNANAIGVYTITYNVSDSSGNAADEVTRTVNVVDTTAPIISFVGGSTVTTEAGVPYTDAGATATDNVDDDTTITNAIIATSTVNVNAIGDYEVRYNVTDSSDNPAVEVVRTVLVRDTIAPVITLIGDTTVTTEFGLSYVDAGATAEDSFEGSLTPAATSTVDVDTLGTYTVTYGISDSSGNPAVEVVRTVEVTDTIAPNAPVITTTSTTTNADSITVEGEAEAGSTITITGGLETATGTATGGSFSILVNLTQDAVNTLSVTATDASNNVSLPSVIVVVEDSIYPIITGVSEGDIKQTVTFSFNEGTATLNGSPVPPTMINTEGVYVLTVTDSAGNQTTVNFEIDTTPPPAPSITTPDQAVNADSITVEGTAEANATITITGGLTTATGTAAGGNFSVSINLAQNAVNTLSVTATDIAGNVSSSSIVVITEDSTPPAAPTITTAPQTVNADMLTIEGSAEINSTITITGGLATATGTATGGNFSVSVNLTQDATNTLSITATDVYGNVSSSSVIVIVEDSTAPAAPTIATLPQTINADSITIEGTAEADSLITITGGFAAATGTATGGSFSISVSLTQDAVNTLSVTATDSVNNESSAATVQITEDSTAPSAPAITTEPQIINASSLLVVGTAEANASIEITGGAATASGTASGAGNYLISVLLAQDATNTLSITATDAAGNESSSSVIVIVEDSTPPVITITGANPATIEVGSVYVDAGATAEDVVAGNLTSQIATSSNVNTGVLGTYSIIYTVADAVENETSETRTVNVVDTTVPVISLIGSSTVTAEAGIPYVDEGATATDNYDNDITVAIVSTSTVNTSELGTYSVTYGVSDSSDNPAIEVTRTVIVEDTIAPVIALTGDATVTTEFGLTYTDAGANVTDSFDPAPALTSTSTVDTNILGTYSVTYNAIDASTNSAAPVTRTVEVVDTTSPVITLNGSSTVTIEAGSAYTDAGATALDNHDGDITASIITTGAVNTAVIGNYEIRYNVSDGSGNAATEVVRAVEVVDVSLPVITLLGSATTTVEYGSIYVDAGATASDNYDGDITASIIISGTVNTNILGENTIRYNVTDSSGNAADEVTRIVNVVDTTAPVITLIGLATIDVEAGTTYTDQGATALDNADGDITTNIATTSTVNTAALGAYSVTFNVSDSSGNAAEQVTRTVNVVDTTSPVITLLGNETITIEFGSVYTDSGSTALDNADGDITENIVATSTVNTGALGTYSVTYGVSDSSGNAAIEVVRTVIVGDTTKPIIALIGESTVTVEFGNDYVDAGATATDNVDGNITANIAIVTTVTTSTTGTYSVTYGVSDSSGNAADIVTRTVEVVDTTAPAGLILNPVTALTNVTSQTISGTKETNSSVLLGGTEIIAIDGTTTWSYNLALSEGVNTISLTSKDVSNNESAPVTSAITLDTEKPTVSGVTNNASYSASVTPTFSDNLAVASATLNGAPFVSGTEVPDEGACELIVTDTAGNTRTVTFTLDFAAPATPVVNPVTTPTNVTSQTVTGTKDANTSVWIDGAQVAALGPATTWSINVALTEGNNTLSITAKDAAGNASSPSVVVIVLDTTGPAAPQASVPEGNYNNAISITLALAGDAENTFFTTNGGEPTVTSTEYITGVIGINGANGETTTLKAVSFDALGNRGGTMSVNYTFDTEGPVITLNGSSTVSIEQGRTYADEGAAATDAADGDLTANITTSTTLNNLIVGTYTLTYSVTDSAGNTGSAVRTIEVTGDITAPELTVLGDNPFTLEQGETYTDEGAEAVDLVDGDITDSIITTNPVNRDIPGTYTVTYAITDAAGNATETTRTVIVNADQTPPVITLTGNASVEAAGGSAYTDAGATANDNIDGDVTGNIITTNPVNTDEEAAYTVRYNVEDTRGNQASEVTRTVQVVRDITAPVITIIGENPTNIELKEVYFDKGASASDAVNGIVAVTAVSTVNTEIAGPYTVTYTARDASGNTATAIRNVNVTSDVTAPVITLIGGKTINVIASSTYADAGATALDNVDGDITTRIVSLNEVNATAIGTYTVSYNVTDSAGNEAGEVTRTVNVIAEGGDVIIPVITLIGSSTVEIAQDTVYEDAGATALDDTDGDISANIIASTTLTTSITGTYTVTYNVTDTAGNTAEEKVRTVRVVDVTAPTITLLGQSSVNVKKNSAYTDAGATATDDTDGDISASVTSTSTVNTATAGAYAVTYNVSDAAGNAATPAVRTVNVNELSTPVLANLTPTNSPLFILGSSTVQIAVEISDADDERVSYNVEISSSDPDTNHWPALEKFTPFEPTTGLNNFNAIGTVKFTIHSKEFWNNATLTITARDRDGNEAAITRSVRTRP